MPTFRNSLVLGVCLLTCAGVLAGCSQDKCSTAVPDLAPSELVVPDFALSLAPTPILVLPGMSGAVSIKIIRRGGFTEAVSLAVTGVPIDVTATVNPNPAAGASATLTLSAQPCAARSAAELTLSGHSGALNTTTKFDLDIGVNPAACPDGGVVSDLREPTLDAAGALFGSNLIINAGADVGLGSSDGGTVSSVPGWMTVGTFTEVQYGASGFPTVTDPGPPNRGNNFFAGGKNGPNTTVSTATQSIDVSAEATAIDGGMVSYNLSGYLGGYTTQGDNAVLAASFENAGSILEKATIGPVTAAARNNMTGLLQRSSVGMLPAGTRTIKVLLTMTRVDGDYDDAYADSLSLVLTKP